MGQEGSEEGHSLLCSLMVFISFSDKVESILLMCFFEVWVEMFEILHLKSE